MSDDIRIYVADLAAYNNGKLHGVWINALDEVGEIQEQVNAMLKDSPEGHAEEWAIHDFEGFGGYGLSEYEGFERVHDLACFINENSEIAGELLNHFDGDLSEATKAIEENYNGCYSSIADYVQELTQDTSEIPEHLAFYIDYEKMGRDMDLNGDILTIQTAHDEVHIFWNH